MSLGEKIKSLREQRVISQEQLANQMNVTRQAVSEWEQGMNLPDINNIVALSEILDVTTDHLLKPSSGFSESPWWEIPSKHGNAIVEPERSSDWTEVFYLFAMAAYLILGFGWGLWHPGWLVFSIAWALEDLVKFVKSDKQEVALYGLATVAFFVMGFFFDLWQFAWLTYVTASIIEYITTPKI